MSDKDNHENSKSKNTPINSDDFLIGKVGRLTSIWDFLNAKRNRLLIFGIVFVIVIVGVALSVNKENKKTSKTTPNSKTSNYVFKIKDKEYSQNEVDKLINYPLSYSKKTKDEASKLAYQYLKNQAVAKELQIEPSKPEIDAAEKFYLANTLYLKDPDYKPWLDLISYDYALQQSIFNKNIGAPQGYSYIFRFGEHLESGLAYTPPGLNDPKLVAEDKSYADTKAKFYHQELIDNKITTAAALSEIKNDGKLGYMNTAGSNKSVKFGYDTNKGWESQVLFPDIITTIKNQTKTGLGDIKTGKVSIVENPTKDSDYAETFYYFVYLDKASKNDLRDQYNKLLDSISSDYRGYDS